MSEHLTTTQRGSTTIVTIDDGKANALSGALITGLTGTIDTAVSDGSTAVVIAGRPGVFSGGFDLGVMRSGDAAAVVNLVADGGDLVRHLFGAPIPIVAACTGHAVAAGALLLLGCDVRVGADGPYRLGLNEVSIGMVLPDWAVTIAAERLPRPAYQRSVFNARLTGPRDAVSVGFLDQVVAPDEVLDVAVEEAETLGSLELGAYRGSVDRFRGPVLGRMAEQIAADRAPFA
ncbi:MAG: crotonase/enoyl-CoA hydratase family protein [Acidimicrobiia bacterium]|nr:crotonase/enoyl-CoA hydratase family protein [Acidimicrobiia bacterium]